MLDQLAEGGVGCAVALRNGCHLWEAWPWSVCRKSQIVKPTARGTIRVSAMHCLV